MSQPDRISESTFDGALASIDRLEVENRELRKRVASLEESLRLRIADYRNAVETLFDWQNRANAPHCESCWGEKRSPIMDACEDCAGTGFEWSLPR